MIEKLFHAEIKFLEIIWEHEPLPSRRLVELCADRLGWKKSTTYTVLRKLCERGMLRNDDTIVTSIAKREDVQRYESRTVMERAFNWSLPQFVTAFLSEHKLSHDDAEELKSIISQYASELDEK